MDVDEIGGNLLFENLWKRVTVMLLNVVFSGNQLVHFWSSDIGLFHFKWEYHE